MLIFVTPKLGVDKRGNRELLPYSYRSRAAIPSANIKVSTVTHDIKDATKKDVVVLGKKHTLEDAEYLKSKNIKFIVDIADDKFKLFKHWYQTIPMANAVVTTCEYLRDIILEETGCKSIVIPDPTERPRMPPKFEKKERLNILFYGSSGNFAKIDWYSVMETLNGIYPNDLKILTNKPEHPPKGWKGLKTNVYHLSEEQISKQVSTANYIYQNLTYDWTFELQEVLVNQADIILLPTHWDRESMCKGNNRPIDAIQMGKFVLTNPGIPSYEKIREHMWCGYIGEGFKWITNPNNTKAILSKIKNGQTMIDEFYTPKAVGRQWENVYNIVKKDEE